MGGVSFGYNVFWRMVSFVGPNSVLVVIFRFHVVLNCFWRVLGVIGRIQSIIIQLHFAEYK